ncbi:hypothetical protein FFLO_02790 [Filobasidium floriforme]|uniref:Uncharacterized protein n=1 Tax=Filobasidium floriforme TaxID=5210 RepID=A0A8K0JMB2_9TREE|nr:hypothetical protein FFLO_02790 [Filobasidium floriforme]
MDRCIHLLRHERSHWPVHLLVVRPPPSIWTTIKIAVVVISILRLLAGVSAFPIFRLRNRSLNGSPERTRRYWQVFRSTNSEASAAA